MDSIPQQLALPLFGDKRCGTCRETLPLTAFNKRTSSKDGHHTRCRQCDHQKAREWAAKNQEHLRQYRANNRGHHHDLWVAWEAKNQDRLRVYRRKYGAAYYQENKAAILAKTNLYREQNADAVKERKRSYYHRNRGRILSKNRQWRLDNPVTCKARGKAAYARHREANQAKARKYYEQNKERLIAYQLAYAQEHRDEKIAYLKNYYVHNKARATENGLRWRKSNPEQYRASVKVNKHRRRARLQNAGHFTAQEWRDLCCLYEYRCLCCRKQFSFKDLTVDHIVPISKMGANTVDNLQPLCLPCNLTKHTKTIDYRPE